MAIQYIPPTTTKANRIKIDDTNNNFESNNVEGALNEVINKIRESDAIDDGNISKNSTFSSQKIDSEFDKTNTQLEGVKTDVENLKKNGVGGGTTPNIQVGNVTTLEPNEQVTVTRRGTDAEPIFDFSIPRGKTGATGQKGEQGLPGKDGITPNIQIGTVTTLKPNQQATVVNVGTLENPIFDFGIPKGVDGEGRGDILFTTEIIDGTLTLTTDKYQTTTMKNNTTIVLPQVDKFTEIHLFFSATEDLTLTLPKVKWQNEPTIENGKTYEFIFTYTTEWLGGCICYG